LPHDLTFGKHRRLIVHPPSDRRTVVPHWRTHPCNTLRVFHPPQTRPPFDRQYAREEDIHRRVLRLPGTWGFDTSIGTMLRLPLGNESMASYSEQLNQTVTRETIDRLFARFRPGMFNCSLFLNSFRSIQLKETDERIGELVQLNAVVTALLPEVQEEHENFVRCLRKLSADVSDKSLQLRDIWIVRLLCRCIFHL
jgi:hypothetical protein